MKLLTALIILLTSTCLAFGQTIKALENDLSLSKSPNDVGEKIATARILLQKDPFNLNAVSYICKYYRGKDIDSVSLFFENLIVKNPTRPEPYILRSRLVSYEEGYSNKPDNRKKQIEYLHLALQIDNLNTIAMLKLAEIYYDDFIYKTKSAAFARDNIKSTDSTPNNNIQEIEQSIFKHSADSALKYFYDLWYTAGDLKKVIYFPIKQLECYLKKENGYNVTDETGMADSNCFLPVWYFANLSEDWQCNNSVNYLDKINSSKSTVKWVSAQLCALKEPSLFNAKVADDYECYRFTRLPSFHHPISIRLENKEKRILLYWKIGKGAGGYKPTGIEKAGMIKLTEEDWREFVKLFKLTNFNSSPNEVYVPQSDGTSILLEHKARQRFKAQFSDQWSDKVEHCWLYLLSKAKVHLESAD